MFISCFVLDAINKDKEEEEETEEEESVEATLISVVKMIMRPTCLSSLYGSYAYVFYIVHFLFCFTVDASGQDEEGEKGDFEEGDGINFNYGAICERGVVSIIGNSLHGEQIPSNYIKIRVDEINKNDARHLRLNHNIECGGCTERSLYPHLTASS